jgi:hypothetical protein
LDADTGKGSAFSAGAGLAFGAGKWRISALRRGVAAAATGGTLTSGEVNLTISETAPTEMHKPTKTMNGANAIK